MYAFQQSFSVPFIGTDRAEEAKAASGSLSEADVGMASANSWTARQPSQGPVKITAIVLGKCHPGGSAMLDGRLIPTGSDLADPVIGGKIDCYLETSAGRTLIGSGANQLLKDMPRSISSFSRLNVVFSGNDEYLTASVGVASGPEMKVVMPSTKEGTSSYRAATAAAKPGGTPGDLQLGLLSSAEDSGGSLQQHAETGLQGGLFQELNYGEDGVPAAEAIDIQGDDVLVVLAGEKNATALHVRQHFAA
ncbi:hypothetical protein COCSUDRAFT_62199 [Coccomyxa subellipsoidea C-169]|uniref:Uncharacterized protein n=1 Tax=Coccomyxa subellipsoidea (strain C-169) TaxID=574566 RepID=I0Z2C0_COCSC|nr:hypothetical protein COCSUDRAFT_62199 [Coccomyxa subellipsoidea C-169]EIE24789.1 hypothetical protein COCSUDRAFT_62199 [Coccomyxa subellipsoidea C-169]|eukprot:XP_005649333.1 hypothetical protein COCSUDRAFT_62199 [Coccomyxa subellipsoidea C-169]